MLKASGSIPPWRNLAAFLPLALFFINCHGCSKNADEKHLSSLAAIGMSQEPEHNDIALYLPNVCKGNNKKAFPAIIAHYLAQSFPEGTLLEDALANDIGKLECAPGPYFFDRESPIDALDKRWNLKSSPNYFVVHMDGQKFSDESFYIATKNGFPIHCQYYKLQQNDNATLVLLPKARMEPQKVYFLYLILSQGDSRRTWIQPLTIAES
ncbi:MAG TPA: hypothetical protein VEK06_02220 [Myxococcota bacterium]|nr:hypothetical protein [Myxococcota bacterium]